MKNSFKFNPIVWRKRYVWPRYKYYWEAHVGNRIVASLHRSHHNSRKWVGSTESIVYSHLPEPLPIDKAKRLIGDRYAEYCEHFIDSFVEGMQ